MKIFVFSDSHGSIGKMQDIISRSRMTADLVIHLGDNVSDIQEIRNMYPQIAFLYVKGNCDAFGLASGAPVEYSVTLENKRFDLTHGHLKGVKSGELFGLEYDAARNKYDVVLYGHTHIAHFEQKNGVYYFNPGSISRPRDGSGVTYGVIDLTPQNIYFKIIDTEEKL